MASPVKSDFPKFLDGDVLLIISPTQYYKLHSQVLSTHSTFFAESIATKPGPKLNAQARREHAAAYRFEFQPGGVPGKFGEFLRVVRKKLHCSFTTMVLTFISQDIGESGRPPRNALPLVADNDNGKAIGSQMANRAWDWLLGTFYNREPHFDDGSLAGVLSCVMALIECAEAVGSLDQVRDVVDLALMRQDTILWTSIMGNPVVWIELGRRVRSPAIYREAAVHLIGQWETITEADKDRIGPDIRAMLEAKAVELGLAKEAIELRILGHYPHFMMRSATDKPGRPSYSSDIYMWMAVCFFRQWFGQNVADDRTRRAPDGGLNFYSALHESGPAYLNHVDFQDFHRYFPMSAKACSLLEANMGVLKEDVKSFVGDLMAERTHLKRADEHGRAIRWLTCAAVDKDDLPWHHAGGASATASASASVVGGGGGGHDEELRNLYDALDDENAVAAAPRTPKPKKPKRKNAATTTSASSQQTRTPTGTSAGRAKKRPRLVADDDGEDDDTYPDFVDPDLERRIHDVDDFDDDFDDDQSIFVPEGSDDGRIRVGDNYF
jgi:hypothetical protein